MKILDWYILKRYLLTFLMMILLFIPIGITVHLAEKIGKILENEVPFGEVIGVLTRFYNLLCAFTLSFISYFYL